MLGESGGVWGVRDVLGNGRDSRNSGVRRHIGDIGAPRGVGSVRGHFGVSGASGV